MMIRSPSLWTMLGNSEEIKIFLLNLIAQKPKLTVDCKRIATAISHFQFSFSEINGGWPIILKFAESGFWFNHKFSFPKLFEIFDTGMHCQFVVQNCHWSVKVPLSCNLMGYLFAIKIKGHEFNMP